MASYIKDFIIYIVPGIIVNSCIIILTNNVDWFIEDFKNNQNNTNIGLLWVIISFIVGFLITQFQIIIFNKKIKKEPLTYLNVITDKNVRLIIDRNIRYLLKVYENKSIKNPTDLRLFCYQYVLNQGTNQIINLIYRADALFLFAVSIYIPSLLLIITILFILKCILLSSLFIFLLATFLLTTLLKKIIHFFRKDKELRIYYGFLVVSSSKIKEEEK